MFCGAYGARIVPDPEGGYLVLFPDVPEAITGGETWDEALEMAEDALAVALLGRVEKGEPLPECKAREKDLVPVAVPAETAAKVLLIELWRRSGLSKSELARRLGVDEKVVRRLLDPDHRSTLGRLEAAIRALGGRLVISALPAPSPAQQAAE